MFVVFYALVLVLGVLSMGFQLLGSRLLSPHFGSSLIVWAWLISTFLAAFSAGSMLGGWMSSRPPAARLRWQLAAAAVAVVSLAVTAFLGRAILGWVEVAFLSINTGLLVSCLGLFFPPVTALSTFGPQCVQWLSSRGTTPGVASGLVYGLSTVGNIAGVMLTAFVLIPNLRVSRLLALWFVVGFAAVAGLILVLQSVERRNEST